MRTGTGTTGSLMQNSKPNRPGQIYAEDLHEGTILQPYSGGRAGTPIRVVKILNKTILIQVLWKEPLFPGHNTSELEERYKTDLGMMPYSTGVWNSLNWCEEVQNNTLKEG